MARFYKNKTITNKITGKPVFERLKYPIGKTVDVGSRLCIIIATMESLYQKIVPDGYDYLLEDVINKELIPVKEADFIFKKYHIAISLKNGDKHQNF